MRNTKQWKLIYILQHDILKLVNSISFTELSIRYVIFAFQTEYNTEVLSRRLLENGIEYSR